MTAKSCNLSPSWVCSPSTGRVEVGRSMYRIEALKVQQGPPEGERGVIDASMMALRKAEHDDSNAVRCPRAERRKLEAGAYDTVRRPVAEVRETRAWYLQKVSEAAYVQSWRCMYSHDAAPCRMNRRCSKTVAEVQEEGPAEGSPTPSSRLVEGSNAEVLSTRIS
eukprot:1756416-Rhodomonas_salina.1